MNKAFKEIINCNIIRLMKKNNNEKKKPHPGFVVG